VTLFTCRCACCRKRESDSMLGAQLRSASVAKFGPLDQSDLAPGINWVIDWAEKGIHDSPIWKTFADNIRQRAAHKGIKLDGGK
jgi:hypothetical protein